MLVGAIHNDGSASNAGHVRLFENINSSWTQLGSDIDGEAASDLFGHSVSLSGNGKTIAVGGPYYDHTGTNFGIVKLYTINENTTNNGLVIEGVTLKDGNLNAGSNCTITASNFNVGTINGVNAVFSNNVTGDLIGNVTGDLVGNVTGDLVGGVTGDLIGNVTGTVSSLSNHTTDNLAQCCNVVVCGSL